MSKYLYLFILLLLPMTGHASQTPHVVVTIKPLHSLVATVMEGVAEPALLLDGNYSAHSHTLTPSQAEMLNDADMIVMIDRHYEGFLQNTLQALPQRPTIIEVVETPNIALYEARKLERYSKRHDHHGHDHHGHHHHDEESHYHAGGIDPHIWLDPDNAVIITLHLARRLADRDPKNGAKYLQNANRFLLTINSLQSNIRQLLKIPPLDKDTIAYLTFHDAYQYYENHFNLALSPYITPSPEIALGAKSVQQLHAMARRKEINCIFKEPQFSSKLVDQLAQKTGAKVMEIDPLGSDFPKGKDAYFRLMHKLTEAVQHCMKPKLKQ